jgi:hypothetical protein
MTMPEFSPTKPGDATTRIVTALLDAACKKKRQDEPRRSYLGASMMGGECLRAVAYDYHDFKRDPEREFSGRMIRIFDMGHMGETMMAQYLALAGFELVTTDADGKQFEYVQAGGKMKGHIDGKIVAGPDIGCAWPALWENKALNDDNFKKVVQHGIRKAKGVYFAQVQIYMAYMALDRCLFTCINKDTCEIYAEIIALDIQRAQEVSDRGVRVITSASPKEFQRIGRDETDFRCRFCDWHDRCWEVGKPKVSPPAPSWLTKKK